MMILPFLSLLLNIGYIGVVVEAIQGLSGCYMANTAAVSPCLLTRNDLEINFDWTVSPPPLPGFFSAIWQGQLVPQVAASFTFSVNTSPKDCVRLWVNDHYLLDCSNISAYGLPLRGGEEVFIRLEYTHIDLDAGPYIQLKWAANEEPPNVIPSSVLLPSIPVYRQQYFAEREKEEKGWNTWSSANILSISLLPSGISFNFSVIDSEDNTSMPVIDKPSCDDQQFPAKLGLHAPRGSYVEVERFVWKDLALRWESAALDDGSTNVIVQLSTLQQNKGSYRLLLCGSVPRLWFPRMCNVTCGPSMLKSQCVGFPEVTLYDVSDGKDKDSCGLGEGNVKCLSIAIPGGEGAGAFISSDRKYGGDDVRRLMTQAREELLSSFSQFGPLNESYAGMCTALGWDSVYSTIDGIVLEIDRGWGLSYEAGYLMYEWDTYFASWMGLHVDPWIALNSIIRMTLAAVPDGHVPGLFAGTCGEVDNSKPPLGSEVLWQAYSTLHLLWPVQLLLEKLVEWNRWWMDARCITGLVAPGSHLTFPALSCPRMSHDVLKAAKWETGMDNSPVYDSATFNNDTHMISQWDVGMSALLLRDCEVLARLAELFERADIVQEMQQRFQWIAARLQAELWRDTLYWNKDYLQGQWIDVVTPANFYPMLAGICTPDQVQAMLQHHLINESELCVNSACKYGIPSVSRSNPAFDDNDYWRGRVWGPMNMFLYVALSRYDTIPAANQARKDLAVQSNSVFLQEWVANHRVMENYNSVTGMGCDVGNALPMYHWGALTAFIPLMEDAYLPPPAV